MLIDSVLFLIFFMAIIFYTFVSNLSLIMESNNLLHDQNQPSTKVELAIDVKRVDNAVLKRLINEIKFDDEYVVNGYNRTHNRHNRGR